MFNNGILLKTIILNFIIYNLNTFLFLDSLFFLKKLKQSSYLKDKTNPILIIFFLSGLPISILFIIKLQF